MAVIRAFTVRKIPLVGKTLLRVVLRANILFLVRTIGTCPLAGVMDPADKVVVVRLFADAGQVCGKGSATHLIAFADGVAREASASLKEFLAMGGITRFVLRKRIGESRLPDESGNRLNLVIGQPEVRHLRRRAEVSRLLQPYGNPVLVQLEADVFQVWPDLLHILHQAVGLKIELLQATIQLA